MLKPYFTRFQALSYTLIMVLLTACGLEAQEESKPHPLAGMPLREIGPALTSGRVSDFAFHPTNREVFYVAMASGNLWKTTNDGITWTPVFDNEGSYALGTVALDPRNPDIVWVGTGENNAQRSVGYGDGVYRSLDGGKSWQNMGLKDSGHIAQIRFHATDPNTVYVSAQGPLWNSGGDRGLYRSTDGGSTWEAILEIDEDTGVNEFVIHESDPDTIVASSYQRRRHVWALVNGGPGGGIHKTTDGGATWRKITSGLPGGDIGRIGLASAPSEPNLIYAIVEAADDGSGIYRSTDFGESWEKRSSHSPGSPMYYNELFVDPHDSERVYSVETFTHVTNDGGKNWTRLPITYRHVDDHALWIDPDNTDHLYIGGDGGIYESFDRGQTWRHVQNLPTTQFYRATPDNDTPFYNVCAGTQDNHTQCGPVRTTFTDGITNADWWISKFGDGFKTRFDPNNPDIVYSQAQYGSLMRFDRVTGEKVFITPQPGADENQYKWNWNAPLIVSPHAPERLYYGSEFLFRSDDRGNSWTRVSGDLTRGIDRNELEIMGRVWSVDAIAKNASTSMYGSLIALDESPLQEGLLYVGTDDGLIHVSEDGGDNWRTVESVSGVPDQSLIEDIIASHHDANVAYATVDNHKRGDDKPYVLKTTDQGRSWSVISSDLPERGTAHAIVEDHVMPGLLFVGTEFGVFFSQDDGGSWHELTTLPTISVRDIEIQRREGDLVLGTFGRGVWILDDISPLRVPVDQLDAPNLFSIRDALLFIPDARRGWGGRGDYGHGKYSADNPPHGAVFGYYLPEAIESLRDQRRSDEKERAKEGGDNPYPSWEELRAEDREEDPSVVLTVRDSDGNIVRRVPGRTGKGYHRVAWDLRYPAPDAIDLSATAPWAPWQSAPYGPLALPGEYTVTLSQRVLGEMVDIAGPEPFTVTPLYSGGLVADDRDAVLEFQLQTAALYRAWDATNRVAGEVQSRINHVREAINVSTASSEEQAQAVRSLNARMQDFQVKLNGDSTISSRNEPVPMSISARIGTIVYATWNSQADIPAQYRDSYSIADQQLGEALAELKSITADLETLESAMEGIGAPWTPGRMPDWPAGG